MVMQVRSKERTKTTSYMISINKNNIRTADVLYSDNWNSILVPVEVQRGHNMIVFTNTGPTMGEIYSIDLLVSSF